MRKGIFMFCCFLTTSFSFTSCDEPEVKQKESSQETTIDEVLKYHYQLHPELTPAENARIQITNFSCAIKLPQYMGNSVFDLQGEILHSACYTNGSIFRVYWYISKEGETSAFSPIPFDVTCLSDANILGSTIVTQRTTKTRLIAIVYSSENGTAETPFKIWGYGISPSIVLTKP